MVAAALFGVGKPAFEKSMRKTNEIEQAKDSVILRGQLGLDHQLAATHACRRNKQVFVHKLIKLYVYCATHYVNLRSKW